MFNAKNLLDQVMQTMQGGNAPPSQTGESQPSQSGGGLFGNPTLNSVLSGAGGGLLAGLLLGNKRFREVGGTVATYGGVAALGALAYSAYKNWQSNKPGQNAPGGTSFPAQPSRQGSAPDPLFDSLPAPQVEEHSRAMLSALIAAAKADGNFDERERQLIREHAGSGNDAETDQWLHAEIRKPLDTSAIARLAKTPEMAAEIYLVSLMIVDERNAMEKAYLDKLAEEMQLDPALRVEIERQLAASQSA